MPRNELIWSYHVPWRCKDAPQCSMLQMLSAHSSQLCNKTQAPSQSILLRRAPSVLRDHLVPSPSSPAGRPSTRAFTHTSNIVSTVAARPPAPARLRPRPRGKPTEDLESCRIWTPCRRHLSAHHLHTVYIRYPICRVGSRPTAVRRAFATSNLVSDLGFGLPLSLPLAPRRPRLRGHRDVHGLLQVQLLFVQPCSVPLVDALTH